MRSWTPFRDFASQIQPDGLLLLHVTADERVLERLQESVRVIRYGLVPADVPSPALTADNLRVEGRVFNFDLRGRWATCPAAAFGAGLP